MHDSDWDQDAFDAQLARADALLGDLLDARGEGLHAELRRVIEVAEGTPLAALVPQAQALLALPEETIETLIEAARLMVKAATPTRALARCEDCGRGWGGYMSCPNCGGTVS